MGIFKLWFSMQGAVDRRSYWTSGLLLFALKYAGDGAIVWVADHHLLTPFEFFSPLFTSRERLLGHGNQALLGLMMLWALPFLWVGVSMSVRRAVDAGRSPWLGTLFVLPFVNLLIILFLGIQPSRQPSLHWDPVRPSSIDRVKSALLGITAGVVVALGAVGLSVLVLKQYGFVLFFGTPFVMGATTAYLYNSQQPRTASSTVAVALAGQAMAAGAMLLFALEGLVCITMAFPIAAVSGIFGAVLGRSIALGGTGGGRQLALLLLALPAVTAMAPAVPAIEAQREVVSVIEIDAPPEAVWPNVIGFSELPAPSQAVFALGIAYPMRAVIKGSGVGAVRHCEFSTGPFVEPITRWEPPRRLSFDVESQPAPMHEWSPYRHVHPPHLDGYMRSRRGEFRLTALPGGRTRLEGSTWYTLDLAPNPYWALWTDALVHQIHLRVLQHIARLTVGGPLAG